MLSYLVNIHVTPLHCVHMISRYEACGMNITASVILWNAKHLPQLLLQMQIVRPILINTVRNEDAVKSVEFNSMSR